MNLHIKSICCISRQGEFSKTKILLFECTPNEPTVKRLESIEDEYKVPTTTDAPTKMMDYPEIMQHKAALSKHVPLPPYTQVRIKMVTETSGLIHMKSTNPLWFRHLVCSANHDALRYTVSRGKRSFEDLVLRVIQKQKENERKFSIDHLKQFSATWQKNKL